METARKIRKPQKLKRHRKRKAVISDGHDYIIDWYSVSVALISLLTLVLGALPSVEIFHLEKTVGFFDFIQYLPYAFALFSVIAMCSVILNSIFAFVGSIPRIVCVSMSALSLISIIVSLLLADMRLLCDMTSGGFMMHGLKYGSVILIMLLLSFASASASTLAYLRERDERE